MAMSLLKRSSTRILGVNSVGGNAGRTVFNAVVQSMPSSSRRFASPAAVNDDSPLTVEIPVPFKVHMLEEGLPQSVETSPKELIKFFSDMYKMRRLEIAADTLYTARFIRGFCHLYDGQEAVCVGVEAAINSDDCIVTAYRDHCTHIGRGGSILEVMAELLGRKDGCSLGKGGSMHMYSRKNNFYGGNGIVGAQTPLGTGLAFGLKYLKMPNVSITMYGDGAANQGQLFEAANIAALWDLPVIYVCENNHYGMGTADWRAAKNAEYYKRVDYIPGIKVDGMDVLAVKRSVSFAKEHALKHGPIVLEMDTYRYRGHSVSDSGIGYRERKEIQDIRKARDPIERIRSLLLSKNITTPAEISELEEETKAFVDIQVDKAKESPIPVDSELYTHICSSSKGIQVFGPDRKGTTIIL